MYNEIRTWVKTKFTSLAAVTSIDFREVDTVTQLTNAPANQKYVSYLIQIEKEEPWEKAEDERWRSVAVVIYLSFGMYKRNIDNYQTALDTYIRPLEKYFKAAGVNNVTSTFTITQIADARTENLDKFEGDYLTPVMRFNLLVDDP